MIRTIYYDVINDDFVSGLLDLLRSPAHLC